MKMDLRFIRIKNRTNLYVLSFLEFKFPSLELDRSLNRVLVLAFMGCLFLIKTFNPKFSCATNAGA
uniref:Uncharacterized protein n=2 Tax=Meloidogyne TaxID=189290 RepID=A0A6V7U7H7_MELEN|nr:unnamed protein product [Meloidogyne enterolobii]